MSSMTQVAHQLQAQRKKAQQQVEKLDLAIRALSSFGSRSGGMTFKRKPRFSAAARARIAEAQRARWTKLRAALKK